MKVFKFPSTIQWPEVKSTSGLFGHLDASVLGVTVPIMSIVADQQSALFGQGCYHQGDTKITLGTGAFINVNTGANPQRSSYKSVIPLIAWKIGDDIAYMCESRARGTGAILEWGKRFGLFEHPREIAAIYESVPSSGGLAFVSSFFGLDAPHDDDSAKGALMGISAETCDAHIVRALVEGLCFQIEEIVAVLSRDFTLNSPIRIDGGVCQSDIVCELLAALIQAPIERGVDVDSTLLGASHFAGLASGFWSTRDELQRARKVSRVFSPTSLTASLALSRARWIEAMKRIKKWPFAEDASVQSPVAPKARVTSQPTLSTTPTMPATTSHEPTSNIQQRVPDTAAGQDPSSPFFSLL